MRTVSSRIFLGDVISYQTSRSSGSYSLFFFKVLLYYLMCMPVHVIDVVPMEARRGHGVPWNWGYGCLWRTTRVPRISLGPLREQPVLWATEPSFQDLTILQLTLPILSLKPRRRSYITGASVGIEHSPTSCSLHFD